MESDSVIRVLDLREQDRNIYKKKKRKKCGRRNRKVNKEKKEKENEQAQNPWNICYWIKVIHLSV